MGMGSLLLPSDRNQRVFTWSGTSLHVELGFNQLSPTTSKFYNVSIYQCVYGLVDVPSIPAEPHNYMVIKVLFETLSARWVIAWRRLRIRLSIGHGLKRPLILSALLSLSLMMRFFSPIFQLPHTQFNSISLKWPLIVSDLLCLMMCFYKQQ